MAHEVWRDVVGYEGLYQVSNLGRIKSYDSLIKISDTNQFIRKGRILKHSFLSGKNSYVVLYKDSHRATKRIDYLVADAFLDNDGSGVLVAHLDGDFENCKLENLSWATVDNFFDIHGMLCEKVCNELDGEEWRDAIGYEGIYQVSNFGRVRSVDRIVLHNSRKNADNGYRVLFGEIMTHTTNPGGYPCVMLRKDGVSKFVLVHRLVAKAFIPNPANKPEVDHIDADRTNCNLRNLRWVTRKENNDHIAELGHRVDTSKNFITPEAIAKKKNKLYHRVLRSDGVMYESISDAARKSNRCRKYIVKLIRNHSKSIDGYYYSIVS